MNHITMTHEILEDCFMHSPKFRKAVLDNIVFTKESSLHVELLEAMNGSIQIHRDSFDSKKVMNKIAFIRAIRDISLDRIKEFISMFPNIVQAHSYDFSSPTCTKSLCLVDSKNLAEYYIDTFYTPRQ